MKNYILFLILTFTTLNVHAKWVLIGSAENVVSYVDTESYKQTGPIVRYWELRDYKEPLGIAENNKLYFSSKIKSETNCNTEQSTILAIIDYSENKGNGNIINSYDYNDKHYKHIVPDTLGYAVYKFFCNKK
jgi:hypothetical protein